MRRAGRSVPRLFGAGAFACVAAAILGTPLGVGTRILVVVAIVGAALVARFVNRLPIAAIAVVAFAGAPLPFLATSPSGDRVMRIGLTTSVAPAAAAFALVGLLALALRSRRRRFERRHLLELATLTSGSALGSWTLVGATLLIGGEVPPPIAATGAVYLPLLLVAATFGVDRIFAGRRTNRVVQYLALAVGTNLIAAAGATLAAAGWLDVGHDAEVAIYAAAVLLLAAGLCHPDAADVVAPRDPIERSETTDPSPVHLALAAVVLLVPAALAAASGAAGGPAVGTGVAAKIGLTCILVATVVGGLVHAIRRDAPDQRPGRAVRAERHPGRPIVAEELVRHADVAAGRSKATGWHGRVAREQSTDGSTATPADARLEIEHALHSAIGRDEMRLFHQPIVDVASGRVDGFEALLRWDRNGTLIAPRRFLPIATETGLIDELGAWALHAAVVQLRRWLDDGVVEPHTSISVNMAPHQLADPEFAGFVQATLGASGIAPELLWLEVTESAVLAEPELARTALQALRNVGVGIALDAVGVGSTHVPLWEQFPVQRIKIDRELVRSIDDADPVEGSAAFLDSIAAGAQSSDVDVVAVGVETPAQLRAVRESRCVKAQGFLISHPVPADVAPATVRALEDTDPRTAAMRAHPAGKGRRKDGDPSASSRAEGVGATR